MKAIIFIAIAWVTLLAGPMMVIDPALREWFLNIVMGLILFLSVVAVAIAIAMPRGHGNNLFKSSDE